MPDDALAVFELRVYNLDLNHRPDKIKLQFLMPNYYSGWFDTDLPNR